VAGQVDGRVPSARHGKAIRADLQAAPALLHGQTLQRLAARRAGHDRARQQAIVAQRLRVVAAVDHGRHAHARVDQV